MKPVKIALLCSGRLALPAMQELAFFGQLAVVVIPSHSDDMIASAQFMLTGTSIPVILIDKTSYVEQLKNIITGYKISVGLIITFSYKIPPLVYQLAERGFYNIHPGPLPSYRGSDPVFHQVKNREQQAGVTVHKVSEGFDEGPVVVKE